MNTNVIKPNLRSKIECRARTLINEQDFDDAISITSFTDSPSKASSSSSCCQSLKPNQSLILFESGISIKRLLKGECDAANRRCDNRALPAQSLETVMTLTKVQPSSSNAHKSRRTASKYFNCTLCNFVCTWAYDLSLHLRQKHGVHKKL